MTNNEQSELPEGTAKAHQMSVSQPPVPPRIFTAEEVGRFYVANNLNSTCECCGTADWNVNDPPEGTFWHMPTMFPNGAPGGMSMPCLVLMCKKCFNIRIHAAISVEWWLRANSVAEPSSEA
jgi:hypothetical protein